MSSVVDLLATELVQQYEKHPRKGRFLIGVAGIPGSGKSTLSPSLAIKLNELLALKGRKKCVVIGMDGWHLSREALSKFEDPQEAFRRRGAHFTFDALSYHQFIQTLRDSPSTEPIHFPTFSHELKDPLPSEVPIAEDDEIIVIEGLYVLLDLPPWSEAAQMLDAKIWLQVDHALARERLVRRHLATGVEETQAAAENRVDGSDMLNGEFIEDHLVKDVRVCKVRREGGLELE